MNDSPKRSILRTNWEVEALCHFEAAGKASYSQIANMMVANPSHDAGGIVRRTGLSLNRKGLLRPSPNGGYEVTEQGRGFLLAAPLYTPTNFTKAMQLPGGIVRLYNPSATMTLNSEGQPERINTIMEKSGPIPLLSPTAPLISLATSRLRDAVDRRDGIFASAL